VSAGYATTLGAGWETSLRAYYDRYELEAYYPYDASEDGAPPDVVLNRERDVAQWVGLEGQVSKRVLDTLRLTGGFEGRHDFDLRVRSWDVEPYDLATNIHSDASRIGVFLEGELRLFDRLTLTLGARYDYYSTFGSTVNPRAAAVLNLTDVTTFKLLYGQAYRAPNLWETEFYNFAQRANPNLDPEQIRTAEVALEHYFSPTTRAGVFGFWNQIDDLIGAAESPEGSLFRNAGDAETQGAEVEAEHRTKGGLLGRLSYTIQRTEDGTTNTALSNSPRHLVKANVVVPLWQDKIFSGLEVQYVSEAKTLPGRRVREADAFCLVNFTLFSRELVPGVELSASVRNLFDVDYGYPAGDEYRPAVIGQDGRTFRVRLAYRF
jgi:iron complex outermembrane receptor protein